MIVGTPVSLAHRKPTIYSKHLQDQSLEPIAHRPLIHCLASAASRIRFDGDENIDCGLYDRLPSGTCSAIPSFLGLKL